MDRHKKKVNTKTKNEQKLRNEYEELNQRTDELHSSIRNTPQTEKTNYKSTWYVAHTRGASRSCESAFPERQSGRHSRHAGCTGADNEITDRSTETDGREEEEQEKEAPATARNEPG